MKYLKITNDGICYPEAFTILGVSTARGDNSKVGQFGSGFCHGINVLLRNNLSLTVKSCGMTAEFATIQKSMGERKFQQVIAEINGEIKELGFSTEFGELDWTHISMAIREFVSNAIDQGGCEITVVDEVIEEVCKTSVYVPYTSEVENYHKEIDKHFLHLAGEKFVVGDNHDGDLRVYRKGVLVHHDPKIKSLFRYNIDDIKLDESRNCDSWTVRSFAAKALADSGESIIDTFLSALLGGENVFEVTELPAYLSEWRIGEQLRTSFNRLFPGYSLTTPLMAEFCSKKNKKLVTVDNKTASFLNEMKLPFAETSVGKMGVENGFMPIPVTSDCKRIFNRIWRKMEKIGLTNGKEKPSLAMYAKSMENGSEIQGYYENNTVYINRSGVNAAVILEEIVHHTSGASDCTRDFQTAVLDVAGALI